MKVYRASISDWITGLEYVSYVAILNRLQYKKLMKGKYKWFDKALEPYGLGDDDIHFVFGKHDKIKDGEIITPEFKYKLLEEIKKGE